MADYYVHNLSPHILRFTDGVALHWYGLAYVLGFYLCYKVVLSLSRRGLCEVKPEGVADFITLTAIFGVVLGGRLGYMLLYNWDQFMAAPWNLLLVFQGGMSSHGGFAGVALFLLWYARRHGISWTGLGDALVAGAPLGLLTGRIANFINGELFGRATLVPWAVKFPTEIHHEDFHAVYGMKHGEPFPSLMYPQHSPEILAKAAGEPGGVEGFTGLLTPRHPSQLYEAVGEGLVLFLILYGVRLRFPQLRTGIISGLFFLLYALIRIGLESYRQPDSGSELVMGLTKGQFFSTFMILAGVAFMLWGWKYGKQLQPAGAGVAGATKV